MALCSMRLPSLLLSLNLYFYGAYRLRKLFMSTVPVPQLGMYTIIVCLLRNPAGQVLQAFVPAMSEYKVQDSRVYLVETDT